jgi:GT2 family glycosyltransferase
MTKTIQVLIPALNPNPVFLESVISLTRQTDKNFSVLISNNFSTSGIALFEEARVLLTEAGIECRVVSPPLALDRVQHWNWIASECDAEFAKFLFSGDILLPHAIETFLDAVREKPDCSFFFSSYIYRREGEPDTQVNIGWPGWNSVEKMTEVVNKYGMQFGPPSGVLIRKTIFYSVGFFEPSLPIAADSYLFCKIAATTGAFGISKSSFVFNIHPSRFSKRLPREKRKAFFEALIYRLLIMMYFKEKNKNISWRSSFKILLLRILKMF